MILSKPNRKRGVWGLLSLVCAALTPLTCGAAGLPALILGLVGLRRDSDRTHAIAGLSVASIMLAMVGGWFDVHLASTGVVFTYDWTQTSNGPSIYETLWVDHAKGTLYYSSAD